MRSPELSWDFMRFGFLGRCVSLATFGALLAALIVVGYGLRDNSELLAIAWPASGLLLAALWSSPARNWIWILAVQLLVQVGLYFAYADRGSWQWGTLFAVANAVDGIVGAVLVRHWIAAPELPRIRQVLLLIASIAIGAAVSGLLGAYASIHTSVGVPFLRQWQMWWANSWLGTLVLMPVIMSWAVRWRVPANTAPAPAPLELLAIGGLQLGITCWLFASPPTALSPILHPQVLLLALVIVAAFRLPPRWATTLTALSVLIAAYFAGQHLGPFSSEPNPFVRMGAVQFYLATLIVIDFMLAIVLLEMRNTVLLLRRSEERYRNFVEKSSEAVWQIELDRPMPLGLPLDSQIAWLRRHAYVAECNQPYRRLNHQLGIPDADMRAWRGDVPWAAVYIDRLEEAAAKEYSIDGLQFTVSSGPHSSSYIAAFSGVIVDGKLARLWGVARDITQLVELNEKLKIKQERVQMYARQLTGAEERARRATAVDLHDGIGQQLVGLALTLDAAASRSPPEARLLLGEATHTLREVHAITQRVIADLSPPGLYELGLEPALQWLSVYMRGRDNLQVQLHVNVDDGTFDLELRILAFKLIRELLRNVVKHSGVKAATVNVKMTHEHLNVEVIDTGVGFEWQLSLFETRSQGFGLWSVAERIREAAGELTVDTAPGRGCRVSVMFPLIRPDAMLPSGVPISATRYT
ncbi:MAG TPA: MASE1 domain-containing protein [Steroidobacteraceae bacterium]|nr:MASE1 domain-containing protein [Steroidobacteraceae bacterium]